MPDLQVALDTAIGDEEDGGDIACIVCGRIAEDYPHKGNLLCDGVACGGAQGKAHQLRRHGAGCVDYDAVGPAGFGNIRGQQTWAGNIGRTALTAARRGRGSPRSARREYTPGSWTYDIPICESARAKANSIFSWPKSGWRCTLLISQYRHIQNGIVIW